MKFYSDITKSFYDDLKTAQDSEAKFLAEKEKKEAAEKAKANERTERAHEIDEAFKELTTAYDKYAKLIKDFVKDYGRYHRSIDRTSPLFDDLLSLFTL